MPLSERSVARPGYTMIKPLPEQRNALQSRIHHLQLPNQPQVA